MDEIFNEIDGQKNAITDGVPDFAIIDNDLDSYDIDIQLTNELRQIDSRSQRLEIRYQSLINTREILQNG